MAKIPQANVQQRLQRYMDILRHQLPILRAKYHVRYLGVFGSYVQGNPKKTSDLDVLVDFTESTKPLRIHPTRKRFVLALRHQG